MSTFGLLGVDVESRDARIKGSWSESRMSGIGLADGVLGVLCRNGSLDLFRSCDIVGDILIFPSIR